MVYLSSTLQRDLAQGAVWGLAGAIGSWCAGFGCYFVIGFLAAVISNHISDSWHPRAKWLLFAWKWPGHHHWWTVYRIRATFVGWWYA
ncbi:hypothetical protein [Streptomyces barringtoniae]|nr:hypothetical protein [Streptomyces barringtoniae]MCC5474231.1 hypothetical protein [Streptomyces barringtoniae]